MSSWRGASLIKLRDNFTVSFVYPLPTRKHTLSAQSFVMRRFSVFCSFRNNFMQLARVSEYFDTVMLISIITNNNNNIPD
jgi:hypothetical protein